MKILNVWKWCASSVLNPIKHAWDALSKMFLEEIIFPKTCKNLMCCSWTISSKCSLICNMNNRCKMCTSERGGCIIYWEIDISHPIPIWKDFLTLLKVSKNTLFLSHFLCGTTFTILHDNYNFTSTLLHFFNHCL